jgi:V/A-type H+-transporting ATPase subunit B
VGEDAVSEIDRIYLRFAERFEKEMLNQGNKARSIEETLEIGWRLLAMFPTSELTRIKKEFIEKYLPKS